MRYVLDDYVGQQIGTRIVIGPEQKNGKRRKWLCRCSCGTETFVNVYDLICSQPVTSCKPCSKRKYTSTSALSNWSVRKLTLLQRGPHDVQVDESYLDQLWAQQEGKCAYSGVPLVFAEYGEEQTASLDRIDSHLGYIPGNVQWVHKDVNLMKNKFSHEYFVRMCELIARK